MVKSATTNSKLWQKIFLGIILVINFWLFKDFIQNSFFQDDFFVFYHTQGIKIKESWQLFIPKSNVQYYRPLTVEFFYWIGRLFFGLNAQFFHIVGYVFFCANVILVYFISKFFVKSIKIRLLLTLFYATSAIHFDSLFYVANFSYILGNFFFLAAFYLWLSGKAQLKNKVLIATLFSLGLLSSEFMVVVPFIFAGYLLLIKKISPWDSYLVSSLFVILAVYLLVRLVVFPPDASAYPYSLDKGVVSSIRWFGLFFMNWAETMKDQMCRFYLVCEPFKQTFPQEVNIMLVNALVYIVSFWLIPVAVMIRYKTLVKFIKKHWNVVVFGLLWIIFGLTPIIFVKSQISPHRGTFALFGFLILGFYIWDKLRIQVKTANIVLLIASIVWIYSTYTVVKLNKKVHWVYTRSILARKWIDNVKSKYPYLEKGSTIILNTQDSEVKLALLNDLAIKVIYNDNSIITIYKK